LWYDQNVTPAIDDDVPRSFEFPEPEVNEVYLRASYEQGGIVVGMKKGGLIVHAGGRPVLIDQLPVADTSKPAPPVEKTRLADDGRRASIYCVGPKSAGIGAQSIELSRPSRVVIDRQCSQAITWWSAGNPRQDGPSCSWPDGTQLTITQGKLAAMNPKGYLETKVHYGGMKFADPHPFRYPTYTVEPVDGRIVLEIVTPRP
jgi:hypothetical protein